MRLRGLLLALVYSVITGILPWLVAFGETDTTTPPATYSSSIWPAIAVRPVRVPFARERQPQLLDDALYASITAYRSFDYLSTRRALAGGAHEAMLPQWVVENRGAFMAFEGLATATEVGSSVWLIHHGHRRMARAMNCVSIGLGTASVVNNYEQPLAAPPLPATR